MSFLIHYTSGLVLVPYMAFSGLDIILQFMVKYCLRYLDYIKYRHIFANETSKQDVICITNLFCCYICITNYKR